MSVHHWINDGFMALFFLLVGLELKRELLVGELSNLKAAMLPLVAAVGGMTVPAIIYFSFNPSGSTASGWALPMATDIAFALGVLALLGGRVPTALLTFLVALAIVDDLGAVMIIAIFYTEQLNYTALAGAAVTSALLVCLNLGGVRKIMPYISLGFVLWLFFLSSGVHATLAGVLLAFIIPIRPKYDPKKFLSGAKELLNKIGEIYQAEPNFIKNYKMRANIRTLEAGIHKVQAPAQILEHNMHIPIAFIIIPIFALANAGVPIELSQLGDSILHPVSLGVIGGLVVGKLIGIAGFVWVAIKLGICSLPKELNMNHIIGVSFLGGIGFTMSIFIAELGLLIALKI